MHEFVRGRTYTRAAITDMVVPSPAAKGGKWDTGILEHNGEFFIFANIGTPGRTGHDYSNRWEGSHLRWYHKNSLPSRLAECSTADSTWAKGACVLEKRRTVLRLSTQVWQPPGRSNKSRLIACGFRVPRFEC